MITDMVLLLLACKPDSNADSEPQEDPIQESGGAGFEMPAPPPPEWDATEVTGRIDAAMPYFPDPLTTQKEYVEALSSGDPECPVLFEGWSMLSALQGCTSTTGWTYAGLGSWFVMDGDGDYSLGADFFITAPTGELFIGSGIAQYMDQSWDQWDSVLWGEWSWPLAENWMVDTTSLLLQLHRQGDMMNIEGGWSSPYGTYYFRGFNVNVETCQIANGLIEVRDDRGFWYGLAWDGGGCARFSYEGEDLGEACFDPGQHFCTYAEKITTLAAEPPL